jgi:hypothetical protein
MILSLKRTAKIGVNGIHENHLFCCNLIVIGPQYIEMCLIHLFPPIVSLVNKLLAGRNSPSQ